MAITRRPLRVALVAPSRHPLRRPFLGGMEGVIWSDVAQAIILLIGAAVILIFGIGFAQKVAYGFVSTVFGRRIHIPAIHSKSGAERQFGERAAINAPIQGTAADIIKAAMLEVDADLTARGLRSRLLLQVHDELVLEVAPGELDEVRDLVVDRMYSAIELDVPLDVSTGTGPNWDSAAH